MSFILLLEQMFNGLQLIKLDDVSLIMLMNQCLFMC